MGNNISKKVIIIFSTILVIVLSAVIVSLVTGRTQIPALSDPNGVFYQRLDNQGNVIYKITNLELYEQIKSTDGIDQVLFAIDSHLLKSYIDQVTPEQIAEKVKLLTYGTKDDTEIAKLTATRRAELEAAFERNLALAGYADNHEPYVILLIAREAYARFAMIQDKDITDHAVALEFDNNFFEDIKMVRIRFTSSADAQDVMRRFNLLILGTTNQSLREYLGFRFTSETLKDDNDAIVQAYKTIFTYYTDDAGNIRDLQGVIAFNKGANDIYTNNLSQQFTKDQDGNLINADLEIVIEAAHIFATVTEAQAFKTANTTYYTLTKTNPFDEDERAEVRDRDGILVYRVDKDGKVWDLAEVDVTTTSKLILNKAYTNIKNVASATVNNSKELTEAEVLKKYLEMYNFVYQSNRDAINTNATKEDLIASDNPFLTFNYATERKASPTLSAYMFRTLNLNDEEAVPYTVSPRTFTSGGTAFFYLAYKLTQPAKTDYIALMLDEIVKTIVLPAEAAGNITLPTSGAYGSTISWTSANTQIVSNTGVVTRPSTDTTVKLTYRITLNNVTRNGDINVKFLRSGQTSEVVNDYVVKTFKEMLNDDAQYDVLFQKLVDARLNDSSNGQKWQVEKLVKLRSTFKLTIYDRFLSLDYQQIDSAYVAPKAGHKTNLATLTGRVGYHGAEAINETFTLTADGLMTLALAKNAALYTANTVQWKEVLHSTFFADQFGTQRNIMKNRSDKMKDVLKSVAGFKSEFAYYQQLYAQYGMAFPYKTVSDYAFIQLGAKTEEQMMQYFIKSILQPHFVNETIQRLNLINYFEDTINDYYNNYFSLKVTHLILYFDFNEDGSLDNFFDYKDGLTPAELDDLDALVAGFENAITEYLGLSTANTYTTLVTAYNNALRSDETWGAYKQFGFLLKTETLTQTSLYGNEGSSDTLFYSGEYGVKDSYVPEYTAALTALYQEYRLDQNKTLDFLRSPLVETQFGLHLLTAQKGSKFDQPSAKFAEANPAAPAFTVGITNDSDIPSLAQLKIYAEYVFYDLVYDLSDTGVEELHGITVPKIPTSVMNALQFYFGGQTLVKNNKQLRGLVSELYTVGTLNIDVLYRMSSGTFLANDYSPFTDAQMKSALQALSTIYFNSIFSKYID